MSIIEAAMDDKGYDKVDVWNLEGLINLGDGGCYEPEFNSFDLDTTPQGMTYWTEYYDGERLLDAQTEQFLQGLYDYHKARQERHVSKPKHVTDLYAYGKYLEREKIDEDIITSNLKENIDKSVTSIAFKENKTTVSDVLSGKDETIKLLQDKLDVATEKLECANIDYDKDANILQLEERIEDYKLELDKMSSLCAERLEMWVKNEIDLTAKDAIIKFLYGKLTGGEK